MGTVLLVRHGQASFGADDYDVLSETGWAQGRLLGAWLHEHDVVPTAVVTGGMRRHRETLEAMDSGEDWPTPDVDPGWDEFDHLALVAGHPDLAEGEVDRRGFQRVYEEATARWAAGEPLPEGTETFAGFRSRVRDALGRAVERAGSGRTVLVVSSGGPIGAVGVELLGVPDADPSDPAAVRLWQRLNTVVVNSGFSRLVAGSTGTRLLTFNEHPHLTRAAVSYR